MPVPLTLGNVVCEPEIRNLDGRIVLGVLEDEIFRLQVPVYDGPLMEVCQGTAHLLPQSKRRVLRRGPKP